MSRGDRKMSSFFLATPSHCFPVHFARPFSIIHPSPLDPFCNQKIYPTFGYVLTWGPAQEIRLYTVGCKLERGLVSSIVIRLLNYCAVTVLLMLVLQSNATATWGIVVAFNVGSGNKPALRVRYQIEALGQLWVTSHCVRKGLNLLHQHQKWIITMRRSAVYSIAAVWMRAIGQQTAFSKQSRAGIGEEQTGSGPSLYRVIDVNARPAC